MSLDIEQVEMQCLILRSIDQDHRSETKPIANVNLQAPEMRRDRKNCLNRVKSYFEYEKRTGPIKMQQEALRLAQDFSCSIERVMCPLSKLYSMCHCLIINIILAEKTNASRQ